MQFFSKTITNLGMVFVFILLMSTTKAQDVEVGIMLGGSNYQGDLSDAAVTLGETNFAFGILGRYYLDPRWNIKANIYYGTIAGDDANHTDNPGKVARNLSFESHVLEFSGQVEFNILPFVSKSRRFRFAPYVFTGISVFNFNPRAEDPDGNMVSLHDLRTEGQGRGDNPADEYRLTQIAIPYGIGFKYSMGQGWNLGVEVGQRKTFTDYLDDVSGFYANDPQNMTELERRMSYRAEGYDGSVENYPAGGRRSNPDTDDWYIFTGVTITKTLGRRYKCYAF